MKYRTVIIFIVGLVMLTLAVILLTDNIVSPYVTFAHAKKDYGTYVQVIGRLNRSVPIRHGPDSFSFTLIDKEGTSMRAVHRGPKPLNFEHADQVVLIGTYSPERDIFEADRVLVKCPSKYRSRK